MLLATLGPHMGLEGNVVPGQDACNLGEIYCSEGSLYFKVLNISPCTLAGVDAKNKTLNLQETILGELQGECEMDKHMGRSLNKQQAEEPAEPRAFEKRHAVECCLEEAANSRT